MKFLIVVISLIKICITLKVVPNDPNFVWQGRWERKDPLVPRVAWGGSGFSIAFTNSSQVSVLINDIGPDTNWFKVWLNEELVFTGKNQRNGIGFRDNLDFEKVYKLKVAKRSEAILGESNLVAIDLSDGAKTLPLPEKPIEQKKILFIGDSVTCGYGVLGTPPCSFDWNNSDTTETWAFYTAGYFDAQLSEICWSGIGMVRNYGDNHSSEWPMPKRYPFTTTVQHGDLWNEDSFSPDLIVVRLGTNDFSGASTMWPTDEQFISGSSNFFIHLLQLHPNAELIAACGGTKTIACPDMEKAIEQCSSPRFHYYLLPQLDPSSQYGCDYHPSVEGQKVLASGLITKIKEILGW